MALQLKATARNKRGKRAFRLGGRLFSWNGEMFYMKHIEVVTAAIIQKGRLLTVQRSYGPYTGYWEFPGGKIETGETPQQALQREMQEEMGALVAVGELVGEVTHVYPEFEVTLHCFLCTVMEGPLQLLEHQSARWLDRESLHDVPWLPADIALLDKLSKMLC